MIITKKFSLDITDSTNLYAKRRINSGESLPFYVTAKTQTNGRGRLSSSFYSPKDTGLYLSVAIPYSEDFNIVSLTTKSAVAVTKILEKHTEKQIGIKWVNDIFIDSRKVCGILAEAVNSVETGKIIAVVVGIGINLTTTDFPAEIKSSAGSLGTDIPKEILADEIVTQIFKLISDNNSNYIDYYKSHSAVLGKKIYYFENEVKHEATAIDIDLNGGLVINENGTVKTLSTGEITVRIK